MWQVVHVTLSGDWFGRKMKPAAMRWVGWGGVWGQLVKAARAGVGFGSMIMRCVGLMEM